jgi:pimeloyl-ACP methyl ester carboxylesterase
MEHVSVRPRTPGEGVADSVRTLRGLVRPRLSRRTVILIHGFQNSENAARESYRKFYTSISGSLAFADPRITAHFIGFHWPGDHWHVPTSKLTYPARIGDARQSGDRLADYIGDLRQSTESVILIAHSLGNRVALQAIKRIREKVTNDTYTGPHIDAVFLFAAAVPVTLCTAPDIYPTPLPGSSEYVYYSSRDRILGMIFQIGEQAYSGYWLDAVGRTGAPRNDRWTDAWMTGYDHGDYWNSGRLAADLVRHMGFAATQVGPEERFINVVNDTSPPEGPRRWRRLPRRLLRVFL